MIIDWKVLSIHEYCCVEMFKSFIKVGAATASVLRVR